MRSQELRNILVNGRSHMQPSVEQTHGATSPCFEGSVCFEWVRTNVRTNWEALTTLMGQIAANTAGVVVDGANYSSSTSTFPFTGLLSTAGSTGGSKVYINWLIFDRNYVLLNGGYARMSATPKEQGQDVAHELMASPTITITQPGFVYIYLSNEETTPVEVYFDDFKVIHTKSPVIQADDYYPFGLTFNSYARENAVDQKYLYNGKELQDELSLGWYDYIARQYDPAIGRFLSVDPAADLMRRVSPYAYAFNNPIRFTDPDGMVPGDFLNEKGENIGNDGRNDGKVYVVKTTQSEFDSGVPSAGITKDEAQQTEAYIKANSGNTEAFGEGNIANANSVEIEGSSATRQGMVDIVNQDNGKGGTKDANNREYGGEISVRGEVTASAPGPVSDPSKGGADVTHKTYGDDTRTTFHSHPSGTKSVTTGGGANTVGGATTTTYSFQQAPSGHDVSTAGSNSEYVFGRGTGGGGTVYIYNNQGVQATVPQKYFVNPKTPK